MTYEPSLARIAAEAGVTEHQAKAVATATLRALHRAAVTSEKGPTAAIMESRFCFGLEACYHLTGILENARTTSSHDIPWSETLMRCAPEAGVYVAIVERWLTPDKET